MVQAVIFGIIGFFTCFLLEYLSIYITKKKCKIDEDKSNKNKLNIKYTEAKISPASSKRTVIRKFSTVENFLRMRYKILLFILNISFWSYVGLQVKDIYLAFLISLLFSLAILTSLIDLRIHIIPNEFVLTMLLIGVLLQLKYFDLSTFLIAVGCMVGMTALFLIVAKVIGFRKIGAGDVKLAGAMGFVLGYPVILTALLVMSATILLYCAAGFSTYKITMQSMVPFAPFLMIGMIAGLLTNIIA